MTKRQRGKPRQYRGHSMSDARLLGSARAGVTRAQRRGPIVGSEVAPGWVIFTDPGCSTEEHRLEVVGAMMVLRVRGPWSGVELMDCGCTLELRQAQGHKVIGRQT